MVPSTFFSQIYILKFILIGGVSAAYAFKRCCDQKNEVKSKKNVPPKNRPGLYPLKAKAKNF